MPLPDREIGPRQWGRRKTADKAASPCYFTETDSKLNFCPPTEASYIRPACPIVKTATPSEYLALADTPDLSATAEAWAAKAKLPLLNRSTAALFSKKISSVYFCPPRAKPMLACVRVQ